MIQIQEAQKHADPVPDLQHWLKLDERGQTNKIAWLFTYSILYYGHTRGHKERPFTKTGEQQDRFP